MRQIPKKNYYILVILLVITVLITLLLASLYSNQEKVVASFYEYSNKISSKEFDQFIIENPDAIIYISDKYNLEYKNVEQKLQNRLDELGLKKNFVFIDKKDVNKKFIKKIKNKYEINIKVEEIPVMLVIIDNKVVKNIKVDKNIEIDRLIEYEDFE